jgi:hypothetical protein
MFVATWLSFIGEVVAVPALSIFILKIMSCIRVAIMITGE